MEPHYRIRIYLLTVLVLFGCGALLTRLHELQIDQQERFIKEMPGNGQETVREPGVRGSIVDRNGLELARNRASYEVTFNLEEIRQAYLEQMNKAPTLETVSYEGGMRRMKSEVDIVKIVNEKIIPVLDKLGLTVNNDPKRFAEAIKSHYVTHHGVVPFVYRSNLSYEEFASFAEHRVELPGVYLDLQPQREYPYGSLGCNIVGFVMGWSKGDIPEDAPRRWNHYIGDEKGKAGIEATQDAYLRGKEGTRTLPKDSKGKVLSQNLYYDMPQPGAKVTLTIDAGLQYLVSNALRKAGTAAAVVMDVRTGEILAMGSVPDYDPNDFIPRLTKERNDFYSTDSQVNRPFVDNCIVAVQPGSTFKIPTAIAGSLAGLDDRTYVCSGGLSFGSRVIHCWIFQHNSGSHGPLTLPKAIKQSCNPYFMQLAGGVGSKRMVDTFHMLGFGAKTGIPVTSERAGIVIGDKSWSERFHKTVTPVDNAQLAIGQAEAEATPLQICAMLSAVANGGRYYEPRLVKQVVASDGTVLVKDTPKLKVDLIKEGVKAADIATMHKGMWMAANEPGGTAIRMKMKDYEVGAKTGTAQAPPIPHEKNPHNAWTMCFAPYNDPHYAVVVLVRNGYAGGAVAAPIAKIIVTGLKARDEGKTLPVHPLQPVIGNLKEIKEITLPEDIMDSLDITDDGETGDEAADAGSVPAEEDAPPAVPAPLMVPEVDHEGTVIPHPKSKPHH
jgi:penicillin-binding protein 2